MILVAILVGLIAAILHAPATWLDEAVALASQDRLRLAQAQGTLWNGQAHVLLRVQGSAAQTDSAPPTTRLEGLALPHALQWKFNPFALLAG